MNKRSGVGKCARIFSLMLIFTLIIGGIGVLGTVGEETVDDGGTTQTVTTNKYTYYTGEPVHITMTGLLSGSSTDFSWAYVIKDEDGNWVRAYFLETCDEIISFGPMSYVWNQEYFITEENDPFGDPYFHFPKNGEQVTPGKYYIYSTISYTEDPVEIEILESKYGSSVEVTTGKYTYQLCEPIKITVDGILDKDVFTSAPSILITDNMGNNVFESLFQCIPRNSWISLPYTWTWDQKYVLYEFRGFGGGQEVPPSGEQVPPGKYYAWFDYDGANKAGPAEFEIIEPSPEIPKDISSLKIITDKYTYFMGEPVQITIIGYRAGSSTEFSRGYLIKDELGNWVRDMSWLITCDVVVHLGPDSYTWDQKYDLINEYDLSGNYLIHFSKNGEQVSPGKYYIYACPGSCEPAEIEIVEAPRLRIEKVKISGPDEVFIHKYNEWELKITVSDIFPKTPLSPISWDIMIFENASLEETVSAIENIGGIVTNESYPYLRISITPNLLDDLAHVLSINWIEKTPVYILFNHGTRSGVEENKYLYLKAGTFDPIYGEPNFLKPNLKIDGYRDDEVGYWIVQWSEPVLRETYDKVEELGADIIGYIPKDAYVVRMTNEVKEEVANLPFIRAIVIFQPQYKMPPYLISSYEEYFDIDDVTMENVVVYDVLPAELELLDYELTQGTLTATTKGKGKMGSTHLTWVVGDLTGEAELILKIATRKNPAGKQEFTSPGVYVLNEGVTAEGTDKITKETFKAGPTEPILVTAIEEIQGPNHVGKSIPEDTSAPSVISIAPEGMDPVPNPIQFNPTFFVIVLIFFVSMIITYFEERSTFL